MPSRIPLVDSDSVSYVDSPVSIRLDSPGWFAWLDDPATTCFSYAHFNRRAGYIDGFMTVRKERRQRGGVYWTVYRRRHNRLYKVYVGAATALTRARLEQIAADLHAIAPP